MSESADGATRQRGWLGRTEAIMLMALLPSGAGPGETLPHASPGP
jgi:hypothetical protein